MTAFVGREYELQQLRTLLERHRRGGVALIYGHPGVGKSALVHRWLQDAHAAGWESLYWCGVHGTPPQLVRRCAEVLGQQLRDPAVLASVAWPSLFARLQHATADRPTILVIDALEWAMDSEPLFPFVLSACWEDRFTASDSILIVVCGNVGLMADMLQYRSGLPRLANLTLYLQPLPFAALHSFFPNWSAYERLLVYACVGGMPGYLQCFDRPTVEENVQRSLLDPTVPLRNELRRVAPDLVSVYHRYDAAAEPVLYALAGGAGSVDEVVAATGLPFDSVVDCLEYLDAHKIVARSQLDERYTISHPLLHCYFRFVDPQLELLVQGDVVTAWQHVHPARVEYASTTIRSRSSSSDRWPRMRSGAIPTSTW